MICSLRICKMLPILSKWFIFQVLAFYSRNACLKQLEEHGRSFGSNLLIIFFTLIIFYLALGICTKKFLMGATGVEVIPNISFWMDLPNLVKVSNYNKLNCKILIPFLSWI